MSSPSKIQVFLIATLLSLSGTSVQAASISMSPSFDSAGSPNVVPGDEFIVTLKGSGFPATMGGTVGLQWDSSIISYVGFQESSRWDGAFVLSGNSFDISDINSSGKITALSTITYDAAGVSGNFDIGTLTFAGKSAGTTSLTLLTLDSNGYPIQGGWYTADGNSQISIVPSTISISVVSGYMSASPVPIPAGFWLLGSALALLRGIGLKNGRKS